MSADSDAKYARKKAWLVAVALCVGTLIIGATVHDTDWTPEPEAPPAPAIPSRTVETAQRGGVSLSAELDRRAVLAGSDGRVRVELVVQADDQARGAVVQVPTDLVVVLDRSGSMGGSKIEYARAAVHELISQLDPQDRFALVTYSTGAAMPVYLANAHPHNKRKWRQVVDGISVGGDTNTSQGMDIGLNLVDRNRQHGRAPRVILISDGHANLGDTSATGLAYRAQRASRGEYVLSTVGVGRNFNETLMTTLADAGTGNYYFVDQLWGLAKVFADELGSARDTVAHGLAVTIQPAPGVTVIDAGGYPLERAGTAATFRPGSLFLGQKRHVWVTLAVPTHQAGSVDLGDVSMLFNPGSGTARMELGGLPGIACVEDREQYLAAFDARNWERAVAQDEYNDLQWRVSRYVSAGNKAAAIREIDTFRDDNRSLNESFRSLKVSESISEATRLRDEVEGAFAGPNQQAKQNQLSKTRGQDGYDGRRLGAKR